MIGLLTYSIMELKTHCKVDHYNVDSDGYPQVFEDMKTLPPFSARWVLGEGENPPLDERNQALAEYLIKTWGYSNTYARALEIKRLLQAIAEQ
jgi:hypothetical protein